MILVEADVSEEWDSRTDWRELARAVACAAVASSRHKALIDSDLAIEVSVKFTDDNEVRGLNAVYRSNGRPTNVLSFPMLDSNVLLALTKSGFGEVLLGDVVIAHGVCTAEAIEKGISVQAHASHLIVHGTLHLLGYDHEESDELADAMEKIERNALAAIGIADPYLVTEVQP